jgi:uncharacterized protein YqgQ
MCTHKFRATGLGLISPAKTSIRANSFNEAAFPNASVFPGQSKSHLTDQKKQSSLGDRVPSKAIQTNNVQETTTAPCHNDECAIDDDDDSLYSDESLKTSDDSPEDLKGFFQRLDRKPSLSTRRSLISLLIEAHKGSLGEPETYASRLTPGLDDSTALSPEPTMTSSPYDSDDQYLTMKRIVRPTLLKQVDELPNSQAQPIWADTVCTQAQLATSPRTTRVNMLSRELPESIRHHLLWERHRYLSASAVLKRSHTTEGIVKPKEGFDTRHGYDEADYHTLW